MVMIDLTDGEIFDIGLVVEDFIDREIKQWNALDACTSDGESRQEVLERMRDLLDKLEAAKGATP